MTLKVGRWFELEVLAGAALYVRCGSLDWCSANKALFGVWFPARERRSERRSERTGSRRADPPGPPGGTRTPTYGHAASQVCSKTQISPVVLLKFPRPSSTTRTFPR